MICIDRLLCSCIRNFRMRNCSANNSSTNDFGTVLLSATNSPLTTPTYSPVQLASGSFAMTTLSSPAKPSYGSFGYSVSITNSYAIVGGPSIGNDEVQSSFLNFKFLLRFKI